MGLQSEQVSPGEFNKEALDCVLWVPALLAGSCTICPFSIPLCPSLLPTLSAVLCRVLSLSSAPVSAPWCRVWQQLSGLADGIVKTVGNFAVWKFVPLVNNTATYAPVE